MFNYQVVMRSVIERNNVGTEFANENAFSSTITLATGTEKFLASAADPEATIKKNTQVLVVGSLGGRTVEVAPTDSVRLPR